MKRESGSRGERGMRVVLLNAFPLNAFPLQRFVAVFERVSPSKLVADLERASEVANYIRHPATVQCLSRVIGRELQPTSGFYSYQPNDVVYVIALKQLPARGAEVVAVEVEDLDFLRVEVKP